MNLMDMEITTYHIAGRSANGVIATHIATGISAHSANEPTTMDNRHKAIGLLTDLVDRYEDKPRTATKETGLD